MKRLFKVLLIVIMLLGISTCSEAATTASVKLTANRDIIENGEQVEISFNIIGQKTAAYLTNIYFEDSKLEFVSGPENIVVDKNLIKIVWHDTQRRNRCKRRSNRQTTF